MIEATRENFGHVIDRQKAMPGSWACDKMLLYRLIRAGVSNRDTLSFCTMCAPDPDEPTRTLPQAVVFRAVEVAFGRSNTGEDTKTAQELAVAQLQWLVDCGVDLDSTNQVFLEPALCAAAIGNLRVIFEELVKLGAVKIVSYSAVSVFCAGLLASGLDFGTRQLMCKSSKLRWLVAFESSFDPIENMDAAFTGGSSLLTATYGRRSCPLNLPAELLDDHLCHGPKGRCGHGLFERGPDKDLSLWISLQPKTPGNEIVLRTLTRCIFGDLAAPYAELATWDGSDKTNAKLRPGDSVLLSQPVAGTSIAAILEQDPSTLLLSSVSEAIIIAMLLNPSGANDSCFSVCNDDGRLTWSVAGDSLFASAAMLEPELLGNSEAPVSCLLFCLDEMNEPVHISVQERLLAFNPYHGLTSWLEDLNRRHKDHLRTCGGCSVVNGCVTGIPIPPGVVQHLCKKLRQIQVALMADSKISHFDLLYEVEPLVAARFKMGFETVRSAPGAALRRYITLSADNKQAGNMRKLRMGSERVHAERSKLCKEVRTLVERVESGEDCAPVNAAIELRKFVAEEHQAQAMFMDMPLSLDTSRSQEAHADTITVDNSASQIIPGVNDSVRWLISLEDDLLEKRLESITFENATKSERQEFLASLAGRRIHRLRLRGMAALATREVAGLASKIGSTLVSLKLISCPKLELSESSLATIAGRCPNLEMITVVGPCGMKQFGQRQKSKKSTPTLAFPSLRSLVLVHLPALESIALHFAVKFDGPDDGGRVFVGGCPKVTSEKIMLTGKVKEYHPVLRAFPPPSLALN